MQGPEFHSGRPVSGAALVSQRLWKKKGWKARLCVFPPALAGRPGPPHPGADTRTRTLALPERAAPPRAGFSAQVETHEQLLGLGFVLLWFWF